MYVYTPAEGDKTFGERGLDGANAERFEEEFRNGEWVETFSERIDD